MSRAPIAITAMAELELDINGSAFLVSETEGPCFMCGHPSNLIEINFEAHAHVSCAETAWAEVLKPATPTLVQGFVRCCEHCGCGLGAREGHDDTCAHGCNDGQA